MRSVGYDELGRPVGVRRGEAAKWNFFFFFVLPVGDGGIRQLFASPIEGREGIPSI